ncbi:MAG: TonB-dependent receptor [Catalinimonas sp.]
MRTFFFYLLLAGVATAQPTTQTIRGRITDAQSGFPLPGVNVVVLNTDPTLGGATDLNGYFAVEGVPLGRQSLRVTYLGYEPRLIPNVVVTSGKEVVLDLPLVEAITMADEVVITATPEGSRTNNELTSVSGRAFNLEEAGRYAGALNDPARMAANYAGVAANNDNRNDIVIRGNSPNGLLWRMEGINIPNPSHFGGLNAQGGPVSLLNANVLDRSDFLTSAFPAEYGNALAGVFDLQLRNGNAEKHEFLGQVGFNGFELGAEGPLKKGSKASYVVNYRYSTLGVFSALGVDFGTGAAVPQYQDLTFKVNVPTKKAGRFTVFGVGGPSSIEFLGSEVDLDDLDVNLYADENVDNYSDFQTGVVGASHLYYFNPKTYYKLSVAAARQRDVFRSDSLSIEDRTPVPNVEANLDNDKYSAHLLLSRKFSARHNATAGVIVDLYAFDLQDQIITPGRERVLRAADGSGLLTQAYVQYQYRLSEQLTFNGGLNAQHFEISRSTAVNPRLGVTYQLNERQTIGAGWGLNSQAQPLPVYFTRDAAGVLTNAALDFTRSHHYVLSYDWSLTPHLRIKAETYYQSVYDAPVTHDPSSFSMLNTGADFGPVDEVNLVNGGTGRNLGVELTVERFFNRGYYFLATTSLYDSKYEGSDDVWRSTAFDGGYIVNLLGGKEFRVGKRGNVLSTDLKLTASGGNRRTPVDFEASAARRTEVRRDDLAFTEQNDAYLRADVKVMYRINRRRVTHEIGANFQNVTNRENEFARTYNPRTNTVQTQYQIGFLPVPQYRILF